MARVKRLTVTNSDAILGLEEAEGRHFLTIRGVPAFLLGVDCGTCRFVFSRMHGADDWADHAAGLSVELAAGLTILTDDLIARTSVLLPPGEYSAILIRIKPEVVVAGSENDYFTHEFQALWEEEEPSEPPAEHYRSRSVALDSGRTFFEFVIPFTSAATLNSERVDEYSRRISEGVVPTAWALSRFEIREPSRGLNHQHWYLTHYLIDGHHKVAAAAREGREITLVAFVLSAWRSEFGALLRALGIDDGEAN